ncbi:TetR/AcrR family transcriptional regulator [Photobacterium sagamiensis]|uniref:TetR/AcrR family transcriptional regulator n=1 Tax=Photobacterium sagamiensis TaxID=2910241 RepID=UPI003D13A68B
MTRGRPRDPEKQEQTRQALRDAAKQLLMQKSYRSITIRELAEMAGTQSGMVSYYFGNKEGLFINLLEELGAQRQQFMGDLIQRIQANPQQAIDLLVDSMVGLVTSVPWLVRLLQDEIYSRDSKLRDSVPTKFGAGLIELFTKLRQLGVIRADLEPKFVTASLFSVIMFPVIAEPLLSPVAGTNIQVLRSPEWKQHLVNLLKVGLNAHQD